MTVLRVPDLAIAGKHEHPWNESPALEPAVELMTPLSLVSHFRGMGS
jgi:hypothetical protein